jgi:RimJ/RimL family protein N-acetyltransferase
MHRIWLRVHEDNIRAIRCYHKVGFVNEGQKRDAEFKNGKYIDIVLMSVLRPEWKDEYHPGV